MKSKVFTLILMLSLIGRDLFGYDFQVGSICYNLIGGNNVEVTYQNTSIKYMDTIVIPSTVLYNNVTYTVTRIGEQAFSQSPGLYSVTIPNSVTSIEKCAFGGCSSLTNVNMSDNIISIGQSAFSGCTALTNISIPRGVTNIESSTFYSCSNLTGITIPDGVTTIGSYAFDHCNSLTSVTIPKMVTSIGEGAFGYCGLQSISFKSLNVPTLGIYCFVPFSGVLYVPCGSYNSYQSVISYTYAFATTPTINVEYPLISVYTNDSVKGSISIIESSVSCDSATKTFQANSNLHYHFVQWSDGDTSFIKHVTTQVDCSFIAFFENNNYVVVAQPSDSNGTVLGSGIYKYGSTATLTANHASHYHFSSWSDGNTDNPRIITVNGNETYTAIFEIDTFLVSATAQYGMVSGVGIYDYGSTAVLTAIPDDHCYFTSWIDGDTLLTKTFVVTNDTSFMVHFAQYQYTISAICENCIVTGNGAYRYPDIVTLTVLPNDGYKFVEWNDGNEYNPRVFVVEGDLTLEAICEYAPKTGFDEAIDETPQFYVVGNIIHNFAHETLRIYSVSGKLLIETNADIDMTVYPEGIYIVVDNKGNNMKVVAGNIFMP